jgi:hypothetical protein
LKELSTLSTSDLLEGRYQKYRKIGVFEEETVIMPAIQQAIAQ